jgi:hypothetical protein
VRVHDHGLIAILSATSEKVKHVRFLSRNIWWIAPRAQLLRTDMVKGSRQPSQASG